jgi:hypothetical protein
MLLVGDKFEVVIPLWLVKESKYVAELHATAVPVSTPKEEVTISVVENEDSGPTIDDILPNMPESFRAYAVK